MIGRTLPDGQAMNHKRKLRPVVEGAWWMIGPTPVGLDERLGSRPSPGGISEHNACVDHHIVQSADGAWHLWACVRRTCVGRVLYHWEAARFLDRPWRDTGQFIRCDRAAGECVQDWGGEEWLQSPYFVQHEGLYYMFYGGHATGGQASDGIAYSDPAFPMQMCLMTSCDGRRWTRHCDARGASRIFVGPGEVRDPCVVRIGNRWHCYYAGFSDGNRDRPGFYCRTSEDLVHWSDWTCVHMDLKLAPGAWATECPHVVWRDGYYYLFRTESYYERKTHVFRSEDPMDFGVGDSRPYYVGTFAAAAVEIYRVEGREYVSSSHSPMIGNQLAELMWVQE
jgi:hypothetical protein